MHVWKGKTGWGFKIGKKSFPFKLQWAFCTNIMLLFTAFWSATTAANCFSRQWIHYTFSSSWKCQYQRRSKGNSSPAVSKLLIYWIYGYSIHVYSCIHTRARRRTHTHVHTHTYTRAHTHKIVIRLWLWIFSI